MCKKLLSLLLSLTILLGAVWVPVSADAAQTVTITFRDPENDDYRPDSILADAGAFYLTAIEKVTPPTRTGYNLEGWYISTDSEGKLIKKYIDKIPDTSKEIILLAKWTPKTISVTCDYGYNDRTEIITEIYDSTYSNLPAVAADERPNYNFVGWYTESTSGKPVNEKTTVTNPDAHTVYAHWTRQPIQVKLDYSGGRLDNVNSTTVTVPLGDTYSNVISRYTPVRDGYTFVGWTANNADFNLNTVARQDSPTELTAKWVPAKYTVTLDPNCSDSLTGFDIKSFDIEKDETYAQVGAAALGQTPRRTGYEFKGWFTEKDGGTQVTASTKVTRTEDHTLYAQWTPLELTLNFDYNLPAGIEQDEDTHPYIIPAAVIYGANYGAALPRDPMSVTGDNYVTYAFAGWYTTASDANADSSGTGEVTGKRVWRSDPVELKYSVSPASAALYARWKYNINFYANIDPETGDEIPVSSMDAICGSRYGTLPGQPDGNPSRSFLGWFTDREGIQEVRDTDIADGTTVSLYAKWGDVRTCTLTISGNGAPLPDGYPVSDIFEYGEDLSRFFDQVPNPTRDGYAFAGWYFDAECTGSAVTAGHVMESDCTIYAKWVVNTYLVTLCLNDPDSDDIFQFVDHGTLLSTVLPSPYPERDGYAFDGWYTDEACGTPADTSAAVTADVTLYAKWTEATRIGLVVGGGTLPEGTPSYINVYTGGTYGMLPEPAWLGCTFLGWYTQPEGGVKIERSDVIQDAGSVPATLFAQWSAMDVTVNFNPNGSPNQPRSSSFKIGSKYGTGLPNLSLTWISHEFMGWYTQPVGGSRVDANTVVSVTSNDTTEITLFAHWGFNVSFDPNTGNGTMETETVEMNQPYIMPECTFIPPVGKRFNGWAVGNPNSAVTYLSGSEYTVTRHVTLFATWVTAPLVITATYTPGGTLMTEDNRTNEVVVERGQNITFVASPLPGYVLKELIVDGENYNYTPRHTFKNVTKDHTIYAVFERIGPPSYIICDQGPSCPMYKYGDLTTDAWYHDGVHYCLENVIMGGTSSDRFTPQGNCTRGQLATSLYSYAGRPSFDSAGALPHTYSDVEVSAWYYQPIEWATANGYVAGYSNGKFGPKDLITREQLVTILWQHAGRPNPSYNTLRGFYDASQVSDYAWDAMCWATEECILSGRSVGYLVPKGNATRAEVALMLKNYFELL